MSCSVENTAPCFLPEGSDGQIKFVTLAELFVSDVFEPCCGGENLVLIANDFELTEPNIQEITIVFRHGKHGVFCVFLHPRPCFLEINIRSPSIWRVLTQITTQLKLSAYFL